MEFGSEFIVSDFFFLGACGSLNVTGPRILKGSGTVRRCGLGGGGVALLEEVCPWR